MSRNKRLASLIVLNWNGRWLLEKSLPSVIEAVEYTGESHEIIVVDNGSTDDSVAFVEKNYPIIKMVKLPMNMRYTGGNNAGVKAAKHNIVVFLNNDIIVNKDFLAPLLKHFDAGRVFAVSSRIIMPTIQMGNNRIKETGLTKGRFERGFVEVWQEENNTLSGHPILYAGGASSAVRRDRFLELGGFDSLYDPFYYEDTDLSYRAWKRGWKILYEPKSVVYHKYRGTNNPQNFSPHYIELATKKNYILFIWKNISDKKFLFQHFIFLIFKLVSALFKGNFLFIHAFLWALRQLPQVLVSRFSTLRNARLSDKEIFDSL